VKLVRYGDVGTERPGFIDAEGRIRDLSPVVADVAGAALGPQALRDLARQAAAQEAPLVREAARLGPCVAQVGKIVCVGLNYHAHVREVGAAVPAEPVLFMKAATAICGPNDDVVMPPGAAAVDWEVELAIVIGSPARRVASANALTHIAGFCIVNDVSERDWQLKGTGQWVKGKSADTFAPLGPWLVTRDEVPNPQELSLSLSVNGEVQQSSSTRDMIFDVVTIVSYISHFMTLMPGDLICTGTPPGVGMGKKPPRYLAPGDVMELAIAGLGSQRQRVARA
jgi:2-keto-4-pentenoate hydratase/2-oxohepta-3-ene-1,7-dioic acid hydratase in catechol pathway